MLSKRPILVKRESGANPEQLPAAVNPDSYESIWPFNKPLSRSSFIYGKDDGKENGNWDKSEDLPIAIIYLIFG